jgi:hypothetical protein
MEIRAHFIPEFSSTTRMGIGWYYGCVDRDGHFLISGLPAGSYTLQATAGRHVETLLCKPDQTGSSLVPAKEGWTQVPRTQLYIAERELSLRRNMSGIVLKVKLDQTVIVE